MKRASGKSGDELRPEYKRADFGTLVRGKYALRKGKSAGRATRRPTRTRRERRAG